MSDYGYRDPEFLREPPHDLDVRPPAPGSNRFDRELWGNRAFMVSDASSPFFPNAKSTFTLIDTPSFPRPIPLAIRVRFATALPFVNGGSPVVPAGPFNDFLPADGTTHSISFRLEWALDPRGPFTQQDFTLSTVEPPIPPSADSPFQDRWPIHDIHAAQLRLTALNCTTPMFVEGWCAPMHDMTRAGLRGDVSDLGPGYPEANLTSVGASSASQVILAANTRRTQFLVVNESTSELLLAFAPTCSELLYSVRIPGNAGGVTFAYETYVPAYRGVVSAIWVGELPLGNARITEGAI